MRNPAFAISRHQFPRPFPINSGQYRISTPSTGSFNPLPDTLTVVMQNGQPMLILLLVKNDNDKTPYLVSNVLEDEHGAISIGSPYWTPAKIFFEYTGPVRVAKHVTYQLLK